ncbi:hypothetical protein NL676_011664 [Syzygium grande]|nr:hypothetical protein NL676_011664 [Syzygium grande]
MSTAQGAVTTIFNAHLPTMVGRTKFPSSNSNSRGVSLPCIPFHCPPFKFPPVSYLSRLRSGTMVVSKPGALPVIDMEHGRIRVKFGGNGHGRARTTENFQIWQRSSMEASTKIANFRI